MPYIVDTGTKGSSLPRPSKRIHTLGAGARAPVEVADSDTQIGKRFLLSIKAPSNHPALGYYVLFDNVFGERFETKTFLETNRAAEFRRLR
jgi:hypothetical protein